MTNYDEWKTTETFSDEAEFVARRRDDLVKEWRGDVCKVADAISDALADDEIGTIPAKLAAFTVGITHFSPASRDAISYVELWKFMDKLVVARLERDAETAAQAEYDNRLTGPEGDL